MTHKFIAIFTLFSMLFIQSVQAATPSAILKVTPATATVAEGNNVAVSLVLDTGGQAVIGAKVTVSFSSKLTYHSFDATGSVFNTEVDLPTVDNNSLTFSRVDMNTSYLGSDGFVAKITFVANQSGTANITIDTLKTEIKADSDLTNILKSTENSAITISEPAPAATTTPTPSPTPSPTSSVTPTPTPTATATPSTTPSPSPPLANKTTSSTKTPKSTSSVSTAASSSPTITPTISSSPTSTETATLLPTSVPTSSLVATEEEKKPSFGIRFLGLLFMLLGIGGAYYSFNHIRKHRS